MSRRELESALQKVPFLRTLDVRVEDAKPGMVVLRLPSVEDNHDFQGAVHAGAVAALGDVAAAVALGTHPNLVDVEPLLKGSRIKYLHNSVKDVTAHAEVTTELVDAIRKGLDQQGVAQVEIPVKILDGHGNDVARLQGVFGFRFR